MPAGGPWHRHTVHFQQNMFFVSNFLQDSETISTQLPGLFEVKRSYQQVSKGSNNFWNWKKTLNLFLTLTFFKGEVFFMNGVWLNTSLWWQFLTVVLPWRPRSFLFWVYRSPCVRRCNVNKDINIQGLCANHELVVSSPCPIVLWPHELHDPSPHERVVFAIRTCYSKEYFSSLTKREFI